MLHNVNPTTCLFLFFIIIYFFLVILNRYRLIPIKYYKKKKIDYGHFEKWKNMHKKKYIYAHGFLFYAFVSVI